MNGLEDRVRAATRAIADTVPPADVPPLRLPEETGARSQGARTSSWSRRSQWSPFRRHAGHDQAVGTQWHDRRGDRRRG
jgi:hypothetical protein